MGNSSNINSTPYGNFAVFSEQGSLLFYCDEKKIKWYLKRDLAEKIDEKTIRLKFKHKGVGVDKRLLVQLENICVCCGSKENLTKHHVVPYCYRKHFPEDLKNHNHFDVLILCRDCHDFYEAHFANKLKEDLLDIYDLSIVPSCSIDFERARKASRALLDHEDKIPNKRKEELFGYISVHLGRKPNEKDIEELAKTYEDSKVNLNEVLVSRIGNIEDFNNIWRKDFIKNMNPKHLPKYWKDIK